MSLQRRRVAAKSQRLACDGQHPATHLSLAERAPRTVRQATGLMGSPSGLKARAGSSQTKRRASHAMAKTIRQCWPSRRREELKPVRQATGLTYIRLVADGQRLALHCA